MNKYLLLAIVVVVIVVVVWFSPPRVPQFSKIRGGGGWVTLTQEQEEAVRRTVIEYIEDSRWGWQPLTDGVEPRFELGTSDGAVWYFARTQLMPGSRPGSWRDGRTRDIWVYLRKLVGEER